MSTGEGSELTQPERFVHQALRASMDGQPLRLTLFGGEVVEGRCTATSEDALGAAPFHATPEEEARFGPVKRTITIDHERTVPVADISSLEVLPPSESS